MIEIGGRRIDWDENKAESNARRHGVYFVDAARIFLDDNRIEEYDAEHSINEDRYITIGLVDSILFVVFTERGDSTRMISARRATKAEERRYYGQYTDL